MAQRPRIPLPFGSGLDRESGVAVVEPTSFDDVRNVRLFRGKAEVRLGMASTATLKDNLGGNLDRVILLHPARQESAAIGVGFKTSNRQVHVNRLTTAGIFGSHIASGEASGEWFVNDVGASGPRALAADSYGRVFLAHEQSDFAKRKRTIYYDPNAVPGLQTLTADLDRDGTSETLFFRGVQRYLNYVTGWGFGTGGDQHRPEIMRLSRAGDPLTWRPDDWLAVGQRNDPITAAQPAAQGLLMFKETESHLLFGYSPQTFGQRMVDAYVGCANPRLAVSVNGLVYFWSLDGPRASAGDASTDLAIPLGLNAPAPSDLVAEGAITDAFATYSHDEKAVLFIFGARAYVLHLREPSNPRWVYYEFTDGITSKVVNCAGVFYVTTGSLASGPPVGAPEFTSATSTIDTQLTVSWSNVDAFGSEIVEVWARDVDAAGAWTQVKSVPVSGETQQAVVTGLNPLTDYTLALRYRMNGQFRADTTDPDPTNWPAVVQGTGTTTGRAPTGFTAVWSRTSVSAEKVQLSWTNPYTTVGFSLQIIRNGAVIATVANNGASTQSYDDGTIAGETTYLYNVRAVRYTDNIGAGAGEVSRWTGPNPPTPDIALYSLTANTYIGEWQTGHAGADTEIWDDYPGNVFALQKTETSGITQTTVTVVGMGGNIVRVKVRHKTSAFGTDDFSQFLDLGFVEVI